MSRRDRVRLTFRAACPGAVWARSGVIVTAALLAFIFVPGPTGVAAQGPTLFLSPSSGDPPSAEGSLSGGGWCYPYTSASVTGSDTGGSAYVNRDGSLGGTFNVRGSAGQVKTITVRVECPGIVPITQEASATFAFNAPPTSTPPPTHTPAATNTAPPTSTPTTASTNTPVPVPTATLPPPPAGETPPPTQRPLTPPTPAGATPTPTSAPTPAPAGQPVTGVGQTLTFTGCAPDLPQLNLLFLPMHFIGAPADEEGPSAFGVTVPAVQDKTNSRSFRFEPPPSEPGRLFFVTLEFDDPNCPKSAALEPIAWAPGHDLIVANIPPVQSTLEICAVVDKQPCEYAVVKGAPASDSAAPAAAWPEAWVTETTYYPDDLATRKAQRFRFTTDLPNPETLGVKLQASLWPFPSGPEADPYAPPGLVAQWDVDCANCEFAVDLTVLNPGGAAAPEKAGKSSGGAAWYQPVLKVITAPVKATGAAIDFLAGFFSGNDKDDNSAGEAVQGVKLSSSMAEMPLVSGSENLNLLPKNFYFRVVVDRKNQADAWPAGNTVLLQQIPKPEPITIPGPTATPAPPTPAYKAEIISYHGVIPPQGPKYPCFVVLETAWPAKPSGFAYTTDPALAMPGSKPVQPGQFLCEPDPEEPSLFQKIMSWLKAAINWVSQAWTAVKDFAVNVVLEFTPLGALCDGLGVKDVCKVGLGMALNAALVSAGIPPDIPDFDQLVNQGIEYLAVQAAAQVAIPSEVVKAATDLGGPYAGLALSVAEEKLREETEAAIKNNLQQIVKEIPLTYSKSVSWLPPGIPVRPDDYQPPAAVIRITRLPGVPGGDAGCTAIVTDRVTISADVLKNPPPDWASAINGLPTKLSPLKTYDLYVNEADLVTEGWANGPDKKVTLPALEPGDSVEIPMTFKPNLYKNGWSPLGAVSSQYYFTAWHVLHEFGTITLSVTGSCGSDEFTGSAKTVWEK